MTRKFPMTQKAKMRRQQSVRFVRQTVAALVGIAGIGYVLDRHFADQERVAIAQKPDEPKLSEPADFEPSRLVATRSKPVEFEIGMGLTSALRSRTDAEIGTKAAISQSIARLTAKAELIFAPKMADRVVIVDGVELSREDSPTTIEPSFEGDVWSTVAGDGPSKGIAVLADQVPNASLAVDPDRRQQRQESDHLLTGVPSAMVPSAMVPSATVPIGRVTLPNSSRNPVVLESQAAAPRSEVDLDSNPDPPPTDVPGMRHIADLVPHPPGLPYLGALVDSGSLTLADIVVDSPAEEAGLLVGDEIQAFDGVALKQSLQLARVFRSKSAGDLVTLQVRRGGQTLRLPVRLGSPPLARPN